MGASSVDANGFRAKVNKPPRKDGGKANASTKKKKSAQQVERKRVLKVGLAVRASSSSG